MRWVVWAIGRLGYLLRPYDMVADKRRWFWQPRARCGWSSLDRATRARIAAQIAWDDYRDGRGPRPW
jgi:hypothetical protein